MKQKEARIIVTRGRRSDLRASIGVFIPSEDKYNHRGVAGPGDADIDHTIRTMKQQLERAGHWATVVERSGD